MKKYRAALIGCGRIGSEFDKQIPKKQAFSHAGAYSLCPMTELVAAADVDAKKRGRFSRKWKVSSVYADYNKMFRSEKIDILSVATPPSTHWPVIKEACRYPLKAIYCEKPISESVADAKKIVASCRKNKILLVVNHQRRFGAFYQELKNKLRNGKLGRVQQVTCYYARGVVNTCTHLIDLFIFLFGEVKSIDAKLSKNTSPFSDDPNLDGTLSFKNGLDLSLKACDDRAFLILEIDILTTKARVRIGEKLEYYEARPGKNLLKRKELVPSKAPFAAKYPRYGMVPLNCGVERIVRCLDGKEKPLSTGENAMQALSVIQAMLKEIRS